MCRGHIQLLTYCVLNYADKRLREIRKRQTPYNKKKKKKRPPVEIKKTTKKIPHNLENKLNYLNLNKNWRLIYFYLYTLL